MNMDGKDYKVVASFEKIVNESDRDNYLLETESRVTRNSYVLIDALDVGDIVIVLRLAPEPAPKGNEDGGSK